MFNNCVALEKVNVLCFNTENLTSLNMIFNMCHSLTKLDLSTWKTTNVTEM